MCACVLSVGVENNVTSTKKKNPQNKKTTQKLSLYLWILGLLILIFYIYFCIF